MSFVNAEEITRFLNLDKVEQKRSPLRRLPDGTFGGVAIAAMRSGNIPAGSPGNETWGSQRWHSSGAWDRRLARISPV